MGGTGRSPIFALVFVTAALAACGVGRSVVGGPSDTGAADAFDAVAIDVPAIDAPEVAPIDAPSQDVPEELIDTPAPVDVPMRCAANTDCTGSPTGNICDLSSCLLYTSPSPRD